MTGLDQTLRGNSHQCFSLDDTRIEIVPSPVTMMDLFKQAQKEAADRGESDDSEGYELSSRPVSPSPSVPESSALDLPLEVDNDRFCASARTESSVKEVENNISRRKEKKKLKRSASRKEAASSSKKFNEFKPKTSSLKYHKAAVRIFGHFRASSLKHCKAGSWVCPRADTMNNSPWSLDELVNKHGFRLFAWEGAPTVIVDNDDRIGVVLVGSPKADDWDEVQKEVIKAMDMARETGVAAEALKYEDLHHRRGHFAAIPAGVSFGGGATKPGNLKCKSLFQRRLARMLVANHSIKRVAGFQSAAFATFAPKLYRHYAATLDELFEHKPSLQRNFSNSVFPACTFNCGPQTVSLDHKDTGNLSFGLCALTAFGDYDHTKGGHIILFEMKLIIQFPPGNTILIPSSAVTHANTPIGLTERRYSMAQYAAGGLFRWVAHGHRPAKDLKDEERVAIDGPENERWNAGVGMFSKYHSLERDFAEVFGTTSKE